jgi:hypothetical protein
MRRGRGVRLGVGVGKQPAMFRDKMRREYHA